MFRELAPVTQLSRRRAVLSALLASGVAGGLAGGLSACAPPVRPLNVGTWVFPSYELLFLAREKGWLPPPLIRLVELLSVGEIRAMLEQRRLDAATMTLDEVLQARSHGMDLRVIAILNQSLGADVLMTQPSIRRLEDLRGKRVALEEGALGVLMLDGILEQTRMPMEALKLVLLPMPRAVAALEKGEVDAVVTFEPWVSSLKARGALQLFDSSRIPGRIVDVIAARADLSDDFHPALMRLVASYFEALAEFKSHPKEAAPLLAPRLELEPQEVPRAFYGLQLMDRAANAELMRPGGDFNERIRRMQTILQDRGRLQFGTWVEGILDPRFLPTA
jgi:NitT/TauT family transport system substrate-binding protein